MNDLREEKDKIDKIIDIINWSVVIAIILFYIVLFITFNVMFKDVPRAEVPDWAKWLIWRK